MKEKKPQEIKLWIENRIKFIQDKMEKHPENYYAMFQQYGVLQELLNKINTK